MLKESLKIFNFLKKNKEVSEEVKKVDFVALDLLMHVALADGSIAKDEMDNVLQYIQENYPNEDKEKRIELYQNIMKKSMILYVNTIQNIEYDVLAYLS